MSLERLEITPFAVLAGEIIQRRRSGALTIVRSPARKVLYWAEGDLALITSNVAGESLGEFLTERAVVTPSHASLMLVQDPIDSAWSFQNSSITDRVTRETLLREWMRALFTPLFSVTEGTVVFNEDLPLDPQRRVPSVSMPALVVEGVRSISNGLILRRSLGDLKRVIGRAARSRFQVEDVPLTESERRVAESLSEPRPLDAFLKSAAADSVTAARTILMLHTLGVVEEVEALPQQTSPAGFEEMQRDLEMLVAIGGNDPRSLRAFGVSRQLQQLDHYQVLDVPRGATRPQIIAAAEDMRKRFDPSTYPPVVRDAVQTVCRRIEQAHMILNDPPRRALYDRLLRQEGQHVDEDRMQQELARRDIARQNHARATELAAQNDYYGAIVLLQQAVKFAPDNAEAWHLLGQCQLHNPNWRREAIESFQKALEADPNHLDALLSLGNVFSQQGLTTRAETCYEDVLKIQRDNAHARTRLKTLRKR